MDEDNFKDDVPAEAELANLDALIPEDTEPDICECGECEECIAKTGECTCGDCDIWPCLRHSLRRARRNLERARLSFHSGYYLRYFCIYSPKFKNCIAKCFTDCGANGSEEQSIQRR